MSNQVVARYRDGRLVKGISLDLDPAKPTCHVRPAGSKVVEVKLSELKALFLVKSLDGNSAHDEALTFEANDRRSSGSTKIEVVFQDGERLVGFTNRFPPNRALYYVVPADLKSNNIRILVNSEAVKSIRAMELESA
jgi:hypothetical protein